MIGNILVVLVLGLCVGLAVEHMWKNRKKPHCGGDCAHCMGCESMECPGNQK